MAKTVASVDVRELLKAGAHFGHKASYWNPKMKPFIHSKRGDIYIIDLLQTADRLEAAGQFLRQAAASGQTVLFVGTKRHIRDSIISAAAMAGMPYVVERWFGGMLTNWTTISARLKHLLKLESQLESGELGQKYSKREVGEFREEVENLNQVFGGIKNLEKLPDVLLVADVRIDKIAVKEAKRLGVKVVGIADTNSDPSDLDYPIPANDDATSSIAYIYDYLAAAIAEGKAEHETKRAHAAAKSEEADKPKKTATKKAGTVKKEG